jgi:hypothetical protein
MCFHSGILFCGVFFLSLSCRQPYSWPENESSRGGYILAKRWPKLAHYIASVHARPSFKAVIAEEEAALKSAA